MPGPLHVLLLTNLYPNKVQIRKGVFIRERLRHLLDHDGLSYTVIAPVPWFPFRSAVFGSYCLFAGVPAVEQDLGLEIHHPRYLVIPKIGDAVTPVFYAWSVRRYLRKLKVRPVDVIDAHFVFPDGAAAVRLANSMGCPVCVTARGSDINQMLDEAFAGRWIRWCLGKATALAAVSRSLARRMQAVRNGAVEVQVIPNGVDREKFAMVDREAARARIGAQASAGGALVISVGNLVRSKGHDLVIDAVSGLPDVRLLIIGSGPLKNELQVQIDRADLQRRVTLLQEVRQEALADYYNAADVLVLASSSEGMPNVVLESMACGTPVIATEVGGLKEFLESSSTATRLPERTAGQIGRAIAAVLGAPPDRQAVLQDVAEFDWGQSAARSCDLLRKISRRPVDCDHGGAPD